MSERGIAPPLAAPDLIERVARALEEAPAGPFVLTLPAHDLDPIALLAPGDDAFLWTDRDGRVSAGRSYVLSVNAVAPGPGPFAQLRDMLEWAQVATGSIDGAAPMAPRFLGRVAFEHADQLDDEGRSVDATFDLPQVAWLDDATHGRVLQLATGDPTVAAARSLLLDELRTLESPRSNDAALPRLAGDLAASADRAAWRAVVERALAAIHTGPASKIVLARSVRLRAASEIDAQALARSLLRADGAYRYVVRHGDVTWAGASPERLVEKRADRMWTEAVAGTAIADDADATPLEEREKDRREHLAVVLAIDEALAPHALALEHAEEPLVRKHGRVAHLVTPFEGRVAPGKHVLELAEALHPTPAVAGTPRDVALDFIAKHERLRRGWYAGPIGWFDLNGDGELAVALRCVRIEGTAVDVYAGAGIVAGSDPDAEFDETVLKMRAALASLGFELDP